MGTSGWWILLMFVPFVSAILSIMLYACPEGYADTRKMDTAGVVIASIFGVLMVLSFFGGFLA